MVSEKTKEWAQRGIDHIIASSGEVGRGAEIIFQNGQGVILTDVDGKEYIDISSFVQACNLGYGNKEIIDAITRQLNKLQFSYSTGQVYSSPVAIELAEELSKVTPKNINHFQHTTGGTESVEWSVRAAKSYWYTKGKATKYKVICLTNAYHGMGSFGGGLVGSAAARLPYGIEFPGIVRAPSFGCYRCQLGKKYSDCGIACAKEVEAIIEEEGEDSVAAFIAEPVQGWGGAIDPPAEYFPMVRKILTDHSVLFIDDEVMTGFCRTGKFFAVEHWNVEPDIIAMAKGINSVYTPLGAIGISDDIYETLKGKPYGLSSTGPGALGGLASAVAAIRIYVRDRIAEHTAELGNHVKNRLVKEFLPLPHVGAISGLGLLLGIEIVADKETKRRFPAERDIMRSVLMPKCHQRGVFPRFYRNPKHDRLSVAPPLIITKEQIDKALDILGSILAELK
jgi:adenosylmethionine-8-amino-7-oxononanoate aminotransferase